MQQNSNWYGDDELMLHEVMRFERDEYFHTSWDAVKKHPKMAREYDDGFCGDISSPFEYKVNLPSISLKQMQWCCENCSMRFYRKRNSKIIGSFSNLTVICFESSADAVQFKLIWG